MALSLFSAFRRISLSVIEMLQSLASDNGKVTSLVIPISSSSSLSSLSPVSSPAHKGWVRAKWKEWQVWWSQFHHHDHDHHHHHHHHYHKWRRQLTKVGWGQSGKRFVRSLGTEIPQRGPGAERVWGRRPPVAEGFSLNYVILTFMIMKKFNVFV